MKIIQGFKRTTSICFYFDSGNAVTVTATLPLCHCSYFEYNVIFITHNRDKVLKVSFLLYFVNHITQDKKVFCC